MKAREDTGRVLLVAALFFGGLAVAAFAAGVFSRLAAGEIVALGVFALAFALATYALDRQVRGYVNGLPGMLRKAPSPSPASIPAAPSSPRTSARGWGAAPGRADY